MTQQQKQRMIFVLAGLILLFLTVALTAGTVEAYLAGDGWWSYVAQLSLAVIAISLTIVMGVYTLNSPSPSQEAIQQAGRLHSRSAFRRVNAIHRSLQRLSETIKSMQGENQDVRLDVIQAIVQEQIWTARDSIEDWRDIIPDDVNEILKSTNQYP